MTDRYLWKAAKISPGLSEMFQSTYNTCTYESLVVLLKQFHFFLTCINENQVSFLKN